MPLYDFKCEPCNKAHEISRSMDESGDPAHCPDCSKQMQRIYAPVAAHFKGSGWTPKFHTPNVSNR